MATRFPLSDDPGVHLHALALPWVVPRGESPTGVVWEMGGLYVTCSPATPDAQYTHPFSARLMRHWHAVCENTPGHEQACISRSHTASVGGLLVAAPEGIRGIGLDMEQTTRREPSERVMQRVLPNMDERACVAGLPSLGAWCIKEALWKAWPEKPPHATLPGVTISSVTYRPEAGASCNLVAVGTAYALGGIPLTWALYADILCGVPHWVGVAQS
jgi:hypothetical protein